MKKKLISLLLMVVLLLNSLPLAAFAADDFEWELTDAGTLILTGSGPMPDYTSASRAPWYKDRTKIKAVSMDSRFTTIGDNAFFGCWYLKTITLPQQLTRIGADAFSDCEWLESITLPDSITEIGARAFSDCVKLNRLVLPQELLTIGAAAFSGCSTLNYVEFGEKLTTIESSAFWNSGLYSADLPDSLVEIGNGAFRGTPLSEIVIPAGVEFIGHTAFMGCARMRSASIPASVTEIGEDAFSGVALQRITVDEDNRFYASDDAGVLFDKRMRTLIRYPAGRTSNSYTIPSGVKQIADYAFTHSTRLTSLNMPESLETIGYGAFLQCSLLQYMVFPESVTEIGGSYVTGSGPDFLLRSAVFEGDAPDTIEAATDSSPSFHPDSVTVYYFANNDGWSYPTWNGYDTCPILASGSDSLYQNNYYSDLGVYYFRFTDHEGKPLTDVTVTVDGVSISSGEESSVSFAAIATAESIITISKPGYYDVVLPLVLFDYFNDVALYPLSYTQPFVQAAFIKKSNQSRPVDLLFEGTVFHAGDLKEDTTLYLDINWAGKNPGDIFMSQTLDMSDLLPLREGYNEETNYSVYFTPGSPLYIHMLADGGIYRRKLPVNVVQAVVEVPLDSGDDFDIDMPADDEFLRNFSIGLDLFDNLELSASVAADGTVKGVIGVKIDVDYEDKNKDKQVWEAYDDVKDKLKAADANAYGKSVTNVEGILRRFAKGGPTQVLPPSRTKLVIDAEAGVVGYFSGTLEEDSRGDLYFKFEECTLGISIGGKVTETFQMYGPGGMPFYVGSDWSIKTEFIPTLYNRDGSQLFVEPMDVKGTIDVKVRGGLGWDSIASVGVYGKGGLYLETEIPLEVNSTDLYVAASFGAEARVFCFSADFELLQTDKLYLVGGPNARMMSLEAFNLSEDQNWQPQQRDYLYESSPLSSKNSRAVSGDAVLFQNIYPYAAVQYGVLKNGTEIMVWTGDDGEREDNNRTSLFYSYKTSYGSSWLKPKKVETTDDGTADFNPVLYIHENKAYLAWQNASRPLTDEDTLSTTAETMDITVAALNLAGYKFEVLDTVGTENYDGAHSLTLTSDGEPCVVWASGTGDNILSPDGSVYALHRAIFTEEGTILSNLADELGYIDQTCCDGDKIWFSMDTDLEGSTISDREIFRFDGELSQLTENDAADTKAAFANDVTWYHNGVVHTPTGDAPLLENTDVYQYLQSSHGLDCVVYTVTDAARITALYANFNDGTGWGSPILIAEDTGNIGTFDAAFLSDGTLRVAVAERSVLEDLSLSSGANLRIYTFTPETDLTLDGISYQPGSLVTGGTLSVHAELINNGSTTVNLVEVTIYDGEEWIDSLIFHENILSGSSTALVFPVALGETIPESLTFEINAVGFEDVNSSDNRGVLSLQHSDISLEEARVWSDGEVTELVVLAANRGLAALSDFTVIAEDADGNVLASKEAVALPVGGSEYLSFRLNQPLENGDLVKFKAIAPTDLTENILANNETIAKAISSVKSSEPSVNLHIADGVSGAKVIAELENSPFGDDSGILLCAFYDANDKMLSAVSGVYQPGSHDVQFSFPIRVPSGGSIKLFILNEAYAPTGDCITEMLP